MIIDIHSHHLTQTAPLMIHSVAESRGIPENMPYVSLGLHPWFIRKESLAEKLRHLEEMATDPRVLMIGECGLDKVSDVDFEVQMTAFRAQIELANRLHKPLILHCVRAHNETLKMLRDTGNKVSVIFHGFNRNQQLAAAILKAGHYISLGADLLKDRMSAVVSDIPVDRIFLESDDQDIDIAVLYARVAQLKDITVPNLEKQIEANLHTILGPEFRIV